jgi:hypothetical protein
VTFKGGGGMEKIRQSVTEPFFTFKAFGSKKTFFLTARWALKDIFFHLSLRVQNIFGSKISD